MKWGTSSFCIDLEGPWSQISGKHDITHYTLGLVKLLVTVLASTPKNGQTHSNDSSAIADVGNNFSCYVFIENRIQPKQMQLPGVLYKKGALENYTFTGKQLC